MFASCTRRRVVVVVSAMGGKHKACSAPNFTRGRTIPSGSILAGFHSASSRTRRRRMTTTKATTAATANWKGWLDNVRRCRVLGLDGRRTLISCTRSLGILPSVPEPTLQVLRQFPEVVPYLTDDENDKPEPPVSQLQADFQRVSEILEQIFGQGVERLAAQSILADQLAKRGEIPQALELLWHVCPPTPSSDSSLVAWETQVQLATLRLSLWHENNNNEKVKALVDALQEKLESTKATDGLATICLQNALGLHLLLEHQEWKSVREQTMEKETENPNRTKIVQWLESAVESSSAFPAAKAAIWNNIAITNRLLAPSGSSMDLAMENWKQALNILEETESSPLANKLKAIVWCNMAHSLLFPSPRDSSVDDKDTDMISEASRYAGWAIQILDQMPPCPWKGRALGLAAQCYARTGSAVTAEGLYQSALDLATGFDLYLVRHWYADLCDDWEKREGQALQLRQLAESAAPSWRTTTTTTSSIIPVVYHVGGLLSGLYFLTPTNSTATAAAAEV